jgi:hypothetical protein
MCRWRPDQTTPAPYGFLLPNAIFTTTARSVLPQATTAFTDELPPDLLPTAATLLSEFLLPPPSPYDGFHAEETPYLRWAPYRLGGALKTMGWLVHQ